MLFSNGREEDKTYYFKMIPSSEKWPKHKLQIMWIWNQEKLSSFCTGLFKICKFTWICSAILLDDRAAFRNFLDFTKMWTRWNFLSIFLKWIVKGALSRYFEVFWPSTNFPLNWRKPENNRKFTKVEKHQRDNNKPQRNKDGSGWRRLTRITNNKIEKFS